MNEVAAKLAALAARYADEIEGLELDETASSSREVKATEEGEGGTCYRLDECFVRTAGERVGYAKSERADVPLEDLVAEAVRQARFVDVSDPAGALVAPVAADEAGWNLPGLAAVEGAPAAGSDELLACARAGLAELVARAGAHTGAECLVRVVETQRSVANSRGVLRRDAHRHYFVRMSYVARGAREMHDAEARAYAGELAGVDLAALAARCVAQAEDSLDGGTIESGRYPVVISRAAACRMLVGFWSVFSAEKLARGTSCLSGRRGELVAAPAVTLRDAPGGVAGAPGALGIDAQGTVRRPYTVVEAGRLVGALSEASWAAKLGLPASSGNAARREGLGRIVQNEVVCAPANLYVEPGGSSLEELFARMGEGVYLTDIGDIYHGFDVAGGGISSPCRGAWVRDGRLAEPIAQMTLSDNLDGLLRGVVAAGSELCWCDLEDLDAFWCGAPDLLVGELGLVGVE